MECSVVVHHNHLVFESYHNKFALARNFPKSSLLSPLSSFNFIHPNSFHSIRPKHYSLMASKIPETPPSSGSDSTETPLYNLLYSSLPTPSALPDTVTSSNTEWDVFISFRGGDTRLNFTSHLYSALTRNGIRTYIDDELRTGEEISGALNEAIHKSEIYVVVFSENYADSSWCLNELVEITNYMDTMKRLVIGVYCEIDPSVVRHITGSFKKAMENHEIRVDKTEKSVLERKKWANVEYKIAAAMKKMADKVFSIFAGERGKMEAETEVKFAAEMEKVEAECSALLEEVASQRERIKNWRLALAKVPALSGKPVKERSEADVIEEIVKVILDKIKPNTFSLAKNPVGLVSRLEYIKALFSNVTEGVITVGIYGMSGIGKSTLAKELYDHLLAKRSFEASSFLKNVREDWKTKGPQSVQEQLINDVLKSKITVRYEAEGTKIIKRRICSKNILVLIDDIVNPEQYESLVPATFASGSVVIITTENQDILRAIGVRFTYMLDKLNTHESKELFTQHALKNAKPNDTFIQLSKTILDLADGHPLAIKILSQLTKKPEKQWNYLIQKLQDIPKDIQQKLLISLDALESNEMSLFLDIACFFIGREKEEAIEIMDTYYSKGVKGDGVNPMIDILVERCLLTVDDRDVLGMHNLLKKLGEEVARSKSHDEPGKHTRLWVPEEICGVLKNNKGREEIEGIIPSNFKYQGALEGFSFATDQFKRMSKLRFLYLKKANPIGSFEGTFGNLRWLHWDCYPLQWLPSDFCPQNLVVFELPRSKMTTMWNPEKDPPLLEKLTTLDMSHSLLLTTTPDFSKLPSLQNLNFERCGLLKVDKSIESLVMLATLNLRNCQNLECLPNSFSNMRSLKSLDIGGCSGLKELPTNFGNLKSLKELKAADLTVSTLPISIGRLSKLVDLKLSLNKKLESLPETICDLSALEVLDIDFCSSLEALPINLGNLKSLKELTAIELSVSKLPRSIGELSKLVDLILSFNRKLESLPETICDLRALEVLNINYCSSMEALPINLGNLKSLKELTAMGLSVSKLPRSIGELSKLVSLKLDSNKSLHTLPDTICDLRALEFLSINYCSSLSALPKDLGNIEALKELRAAFTPLEALPDTICHLKSFEHLHISGCNKLKKLPDQLWKLPRLSKLNARGATMLNNLPEIESSQTALPLRFLNLSGSMITTLPSRIIQLSNLEHLVLRDCLHLESIPRLPPSLKLLVASGCTSLNQLDLSNLKQLKILDLEDCSGLTEVPGINEPSLTHLYLHGCQPSIVYHRVSTQPVQRFTNFLN